MREKPQLEDAKIIDSVRRSYGLTMTGLEFLPLGYDSYAGVYRATADDGRTYFLKVKRDPIDELSVGIPRYLYSQGIEQVVAPLPTVTGERWGAVDGFAVLLYPFIDGKSGMTVGLSDRQWFEFGRVLKRIHDSQLPPELFAQMRKETFVPHPKLTGIVRQLQATIQTSACTNPVERQLAIFWEDHHSDIGKIVDRAEQLGRLLQRQSLDCVLCHADIHTGNLLLEPGGALHVVDWDQPILAPKERDLLFAMDEAVGGFGNGHAEELFYLGYGKTEIDRLALAYYRYEWVVQDMGAFAEHVLLMDDTGDEGKQESVDLFMSMFEPGNRVEAAYQLDRTLSIS